MKPAINKDPWSICSSDDIFKRHCFACDVYKDRYILIAGGLDENDQEFTSADMYDTITRTHVSLPDIPASIDASLGLVVGGYFYVQVKLHGLYRLCLTKPLEWELVDEMDGYNIDDMLTDGNKIYFVDEGTKVNTFNRHTKEFTPWIKNHYTYEHYHFASAVVHNKVYVIGGFMGGAVKSAMDVYDLETQMWSPAPCFPKPIHAATATVIDRWIIVTGGQHDDDGEGAYLHEDYVDEPDYNTLIYIYDTFTEKWIESNCAMAAPRRYHRCVKVGNHIVNVGGWTEDIDAFPREVVEINKFIPGWKWYILKPYILLRKLIDVYRAVPIHATKRIKYKNGDNKLDADAVIKKLFTEITLDLFRYVISFMT